MKQGRREERMGVLTVEGALAEARFGDSHLHFAAALQAQVQVSLALRLTLRAHSE